MLKPNILVYDTKIIKKCYFLIPELHFTLLLTLMGHKLTFFVLGTALTVFFFKIYIFVYLTY